ncbi:MAG: adenylate kinase, partial [Campylobacterota bacterium]|nr:adenylate kinase [Campylobacterota bacterium]
KVYHEQTKPLIGYYKEQASKVDSLAYITVDGTANIADVEAAIIAKLG